jgi:hypothetical protein
MIETVTAVLGLVSAGIFLAHAFDGYRSRAWYGFRSDCTFKKPVPKSLINSDQHREWQVYHAEPGCSFRRVFGAHHGKPRAAVLELAGLRPDLNASRPGRIARPAHPSADPIGKPIPDLHRCSTPATARGCRSMFLPLGHAPDVDGNECRINQDDKSAGRTKKRRHVDLLEAVGLRVS